MQGPSNYLQKVLKRLRESPMQTGWMPETTQVIAGECKDRGYTHPNPEGCFPKATLYFDDDAQHKKEIPAMDRKFINEWTKANKKNTFQAVIGMAKVCMR